MKDASFRIIVTVTDERQGLTILLNGGAVTADPVETPYGVRKDFALSTAESLTSPTIELTTTDEAGKVNFSKDGKTIMIYEAAPRVRPIRSMRRSPRQATTRGL